VYQAYVFDDRYITETTNGWGIYEVAPHYEVAKELVLDAPTAALAIVQAILIVAGVTYQKENHEPSINR